MNKEEILKELNAALENELESRLELDRLAMESLNAGISFADNELLFRQSRIIDECTLTVEKLEAMLDEFDEQ